MNTMAEYTRLIVPRHRYGMTFVEILSSLLVLSVGMSAVIGLTFYGLRRAAQVEAQATAMATALTMLRDPTPIGWTADVVTGTISGGGRTEEGWLNGYFVRRVKQQTAADVTADLANRSVQVDVYSAAGASIPAASVGGRQLEPNL